MYLDVVVGGPLDPLFDRPEDLVLFKGTLRGRPYNGSMMMIRAGCRPDVYEDFNQKAALESGRLFCGSDQAWLMHKLGPNEAIWDDRDRSEEHTSELQSLMRISYAVFCLKKKKHKAR